jgi:hypothetical protein
VDVSDVQAGLEQARDEVLKGSAIHTMVEVLKRLIRIAVVSLSKSPPILSSLSIPSAPPLFKRPTIKATNHSKPTRYSLSAP